MKISVLLLRLISTLLSVFMTWQLSGQGIPSLFIVADYMKVAPNKTVEYLDVEQTLWKPMHQKRVNKGKIFGWFLYAVDFAGNNDEYNYVVLGLYDNLDSLENPWSPDVPQKVHPEMEISEIIERTNKSRTRVKSELFYRIATAPQIPLEKPAPYLQVNFMSVKPEMREEYEILETEIWQPIHNELIQQGESTGWGVWSLLFPRGANRPYQYVTLNAFSDYANVFELEIEPAFSGVHPDKSYQDFINKTIKTRTNARIELWQLIDYVIR